MQTQKNVVSLYRRLLTQLAAGLKFTLKPSAQLSRPALGTAFLLLLTTGCNPAFAPLTFGGFVCATALAVVYVWILCRGAHGENPALSDPWQRIPESEEEVFFRPPPAKGYDITIEGEVKIRDSSEKYHADAVYYGPRFRQYHSFLCVNGFCLNDSHLQVLEQDRHLHAYRIRFDSNGGPIGIAFIPKYGSFSGSLRARVDPLPEGTPSLAEERQHATAEEAERKRQQAFEEQVRRFRLRARLKEIWRSPDYRTNCARQKRAKLLVDAQGIEKEFEEVVRDPNLAHHLQTQHPDDYEALIGEFEALKMARRFEVEPPPAPPPPKKRRKLTSEEVRAFKVWRQQRDDADKVALAFSRVEMEQKVEAHLNEQYPDLDADERERLKRRILDQLEEEEGKHAAKVL